MRSYVAFIFESPDRDFGLTFPDLAECHRIAESREEARSLARATLAAHLDELVAAGQPVPAARGLAELVALPEMDGHLEAFLVDA